jgi:hypothetical protein
MILNKLAATVNASLASVDQRIGEGGRVIAIEKCIV